MCVIAYIPKGKQIAEKTIQTMFENNPDGAGLMYQHEGVVKIRKGFFKAEDLVEAYRAIPDDAGDVVIHCRIATTGLVSAACCHPFPVSDVTEEMMQTEIETDCAIAHNGIISFCEPKAGRYAPISDTMLFTQKILYPLKDSLHIEQVRTVIDKAVTPSRVLILTPDDWWAFGQWIEDEGVYYSNSTYARKWSFLNFTSCETDMEQIQLKIDTSHMSKAERGGVLYKIENSLKHLTSYHSRVSKKETREEIELWYTVSGLPTRVKRIAGNEILSRYAV